MPTYDMSSQIANAVLGDTKSLSPGGEVATTPGMQAALKRLDMITSNLRGVEHRMSLILDELIGPRPEQDFVSPEPAPGSIGQLHSLVDNLAAIERRLSLHLDQLVSFTSN